MSSNKLTTHVMLLMLLLTSTLAIGHEQASVSPQGLAAETQTGIAGSVLPPQTVDLGLLPQAAPQALGVTQPKSLHRPLDGLTDEQYEARKEAARQKWLRSLGGEGNQ